MPACTQEAADGHLVILVGNVDSEDLEDVPAGDADAVGGEVEVEGGGREALHVQREGADHGGGFKL